jgi:hypothetical protein
MTSWRINRLLFVAMLLCAAILPACAQPADHQPVKAVASQCLAIATAAGQGQLPVYLSAD